MLVDPIKIEIAVVVDASASMSGRREEVINYVNAILTDKDFIKAGASITLVFFEDATMPIVASVPIREMPELCPNDFFPKGGCAVFDAIGETINLFVRKLAELPPGEAAPGRILFITLTEGQDTASRHYTAEEIERRILMHSANYGWEFRFPIRGLSGTSADSSQTA